MPKRSLSIRNYAYAHLNIGILYDLICRDTAKAMSTIQRYRELMRRGWNGDEMDRRY